MIFSINPKLPKPINSQTSKIVKKTEPKIDMNIQNSKIPNSENVKSEEILKLERIIISTLPHLTSEQMNDFLERYAKTPERKASGYIVPNIDRMVLAMKPEEFKYLSQFDVRQIKPYMIKMMSEEQIRGLAEAVVRTGKFGATSFASDTLDALMDTPIFYNIYWGKE